MRTLIHLTKQQAEHPELFHLFIKEKIGLKPSDYIIKKNKDDVVDEAGNLILDLEWSKK